MSINQIFGGKFVATVKPADSPYEGGILLPEKPILQTVKTQVYRPTSENTAQFANAQTPESQLQQKINHDLNRLVITEADLKGIDFAERINLVQENLANALVIFRVFDQIETDDRLYDIYQIGKLDLLVLINENLRLVREMLLLQGKVTDVEVQDSSLWLPVNSRGFLDFLSSDLESLVNDRLHPDQQKAIYDILLQIELPLEYCEKLWNLMERSKVLSLHPLGLSIFWNLWKLPDFQVYYRQLLENVYTKFDSISHKDYKELAAFVKDIDLPMPIIPTQAVRLGVEVEHVRYGDNGKLVRNRLFNMNIARFEGDLEANYTEYRVKDDPFYQQYPAELGEYQSDLHKLALLILSSKHHQWNSLTVHLHFDSEQNVVPPGNDLFISQPNKRQLPTWEVRDFVPPTLDSWLKTGDLIGFIELLTITSRFVGPRGQLEISAEDLELYKTDSKSAINSIIFRFLSPLLADRSQIFVLVHLLERTRIFEYVNLSGIKDHIKPESMGYFMELLTAWAIGLCNDNQVDLLKYYSQSIPPEVMKSLILNVEINFNSNRFRLYKFILEQFIRDTTIKKTDLLINIPPNSISTIDLNSEQRGLLIELAFWFPDTVHLWLKDFDIKTFNGSLQMLSDVTLSLIIEKFPESFQWKRLVDNDIRLRDLESNALANCLVNVIPKDICQRFTWRSYELLLFLAKHHKATTLWELIFLAPDVEYSPWLNPDILHCIAKDDKVAALLIEKVMSRDPKLLELLSLEENSNLFVEIYKFWGLVNPNQLISFLVWLTSGSDLNRAYDTYNYSSDNRPTRDGLYMLRNTQNWEEIFRSINYGLILRGNQRLGTNEAYW